MQRILENKILIIAITAWIIAGVLKVLIDLWINKKLDWRRIVGSGGMPSQHTATVVSLAIATGTYAGLQSSSFAIAVILAVVVMHDATGVRLETGKQAKVLNKMMENPIFANSGEEFERRLKEYVGHTPFQVLVGAIVGIIVSIVMAQILK